MHNLITRIHINNIVDIKAICCVGSDEGVKCCKMSVVTVVGCYYYVLNYVVGCNLLIVNLLVLMLLVVIVTSRVPVEGKSSVSDLYEI